MNIDCKKNHDEFVALLRASKREGVEQLIIYLESTDFFVAPCSTRFHLSEPGGLCQHSLNVLNDILPLTILTFLSHRFYMTFARQIHINQSCVGAKMKIINGNSMEHIHSMRYLHLAIRKKVYTSLLSSFALWTLKHRPLTVIWDFLMFGEHSLLEIFFNKIALHYCCILPTCMRPILLRMKG